MLYIRHRINTVQELGTVPPPMGIELDLRYEGGELILQHDAFKTGERFDAFLRHYRHAFMILNIKTEGIEDAVSEAIARYGVKEYFFLDVSFPALVKLVKRGEKNIAVRFSEFEPLEQCLALRDQVKWVWVDCFNDLPLNGRNYRKLKQHFQLCLVSPELQGHPKERILEFKKKLRKYPVDAVCTKYPELWAE